MSTHNYIKTKRTTMPYQEVKTFVNSPEQRKVLAEIQREYRRRKKTKLTLQGPAGQAEPCKVDSSPDGGAPC